MDVDRKHEIIEINKMEDLTNSYFIRRGIIYSRDCDNNRLNVWIEGTLFENLEIFYHCEKEIESTPDKAFDLFEVGRKVLVLHKFIYQGEGSKKVKKIERTVIGLKYNSPEGISNLQPCVVRRFFVKVKKGAGESISYSYYWICIDDENNITVLKINDNEDKTQAEVFVGKGFFSELEKALYLGDPGLNPLTESATKSFMMTNDSDFRERWVATPCSLFKDQCEVFNVMPQYWTAPPPCNTEELPCPPNRFYCDIEKRILVWYGAYEIFIGAVIIRFNTDTDYTWNCVAASGASIEAEGYKTLPGTKDDIPINMMPDVKSVNDTEISFYLPHVSIWDRPGVVTINWENYIWGSVMSAVGVNEAKHWYWTENGFEQEVCARFHQDDFDESIVDKDEIFSNDACVCVDYSEVECFSCNVVAQSNGRYIRTVIDISGYTSLYEIYIFDELFNADTTYRHLRIDEKKHYSANRCWWSDDDSQCHGEGVYGYNVAERTLVESLNQKEAEGLSSVWCSNNVAYFFKEKNRDRCDGAAQQVGGFKNTWSGPLTDPYGGPDVDDFYNCKWLQNDCCLWAETCPDGLGKCFEMLMPGSDWILIEEAYVESESGGNYTLIRESDINDFEEPLVRKFKIDEEIEFDATEIYKTYYLDDRATCHEQGLIVAGKGVRGSEIFWEVYHNGVDITNKLFEVLGCEQSELDEMGLI